MMPPLRSFDDVDGRERGQKKTDDLRAMTTLGPRTLLSFQSKFCLISTVLMLNLKQKYTNIVLNDVMCN